jgi:hypothetical protein
MDIEELKNLIQKETEGFRLKIKVSANSKKNSFEFLDDESGNILKKIGGQGYESSRRKNDRQRHESGHRCRKV